MLLSVALAVTTMTSSFDVGGVKVILRESDANNVVAANLYLLGGTRQITPSNAGIEPRKRPFEARLGRLAHSELRAIERAVEILERH